MKHSYLTILAALCVASSSFACSGDGEEYVGSVCTTAADYCPAGTLAADGSVLRITEENYVLFGMIGCVYGGNCQTTFALPDLRGRAPVGLLNDKSNSAITLGMRRGAEAVTLSMEQMPKHTHDARFIPTNLMVNVAVSNVTGSENQPSATNNYLSASSPGNVGADMWASIEKNPVNLAGVAVSGDTQNGTVDVQSAGAAVPVSILPPQLGLNYCIVRKGIIPSK